MRDKKSDVNESKNCYEPVNDMLSSEILKEIGAFVLKETKRRKKNKDKKNILTLTEDLKIKDGKPNKPEKIPVKIATLKSMIQKIVIAELEKRN